MIDQIYQCLFNHLAKFGLVLDEIPYKGWVQTDLTKLLGKLLTQVHTVEHETLCSWGLQEYEEEFLIAQRGVLEAAKEFYKFRVGQIDAAEKKTVTADLMISVNELLEAENVLAKKLGKL